MMASVATTCEECEEKPSYLLHEMGIYASSGNPIGVAPYPAVKLLQDRIAVLVALLIVSHLPQLFS